MTRKWFGTDGIRGRVGETPITPEFVMRLGYAAGRVLAHTADKGEQRAPFAGSAQSFGRRSRPVVLIVKDTRVSGYLL